MDQKKQRSHTPKAKTVDNYDKMEEIRERLGMTKSEFSIALGYVTSGGYEASVRHGKGATLMQLLAAEGVERRYGKTLEIPPSYFLVRFRSNGTVDTIPIDGEPQTAKIMGQEYYLIPK